MAEKTDLKGAKSKYDVSFKYNLKVYWSFLKKYRSIFVLIILLLLINESLNLIQNLLYKQIIDNGTKYGAKTLTLEIFTSILIFIAIVYSISTLIKTVIKWFTSHLQNKLEGNLIMDLKERFFNHIVTLSHSFHVTHKTGALISRINRGSAAIERLTDFLIYNIFPILFQITIMGISLIYLDKTSAIVIGITMVVFVTFSFYIQQMQRKYNQIVNRIEDVEKANLSDILTNVDSIKYYGKEVAIKRKYHNLINNTKRALIRFWNYGRWMSSIQSFIVWAGLLFLVFFSIRNYINGNTTLGTLTFSYSVYGSFMWGYVNGFMNGLRGYYRSMIDFHELFQYGEIEQEVKDAEDAKKTDIKNGEINFRNVSFKYHDRYVIKDFNLKIKPGEKIALVGHSGSGKSTLVKLLYRLYDTKEGDIFIDGENIKKFKQESLRSELSIVPQECILFDDTIFNNIQFSRLEASRREVLDAIRFAQLDKTTKNFQYKENTIVGERGVRLSGGEKQRVSIARAILANKKIIVLDEATSSLDSQTEHEIQADLQKLLEGRTSIIIAHRLSTIMNADRIVVLDKGKIVQIGSHRELIRKPGIYRKLWRLQKGGYIGE